MGSFLPAVNNMRGPFVLGLVTRNLLRTNQAANVTKTRALLVCQKQLQAESDIFRRTLSTSAARLSDDKQVSDQASLAKKIDPKEAAARKAAEEATKKALEKKRIEDAAAKKKDEKASASEAEKETLKKEQEAKAKAEKIKKEQEAKAEAERLKKEQEAKAEAERQEAARKKKEEEIAIANMKDPIQDLFLTSIRAYSTTGGLENADKATQAEVQAELARVAKQFGGGEGEDMSQFPVLDFQDPEVDGINIS